MLGNDRSLLVLSPHLDDAALSVGGWLSARSAAGLGGERSRVLTVFAGIPNYASLAASPLVARLHRAMGDPADPVAVRRGEDIAAMAILGATPVHGDRLDACYRMRGACPAYPTWKAVTGKWSEDERALPAEIAGEIARDLEAQDTLICAPLAIGDHIDHRIVREAGLRLALLGRDVLFFEDVPYSLGAIPAEIRDSGRWLPETVALGATAIAARRRAIGAYRSQAGVLPETASAPVERLWRPRSAAELVHGSEITSS